jgi:hypothetical protein
VTAPTPAQFNRELDELIVAANRLREPYGWAYPWGLSPSVAGDGAGTRNAAVSDPTSSVVMAAGKTRIRNACEGTAKMVLDCGNDLRSTYDRLSHVLGGGKPETRMTPQGPFPITVSRVELEEAHEAQRRRRIRSESYGEG